MRKLNAVELCFYKLLLLKSEIFKNKIIDLSYLEQQTKIDSHRLFEPLKNLLKDKIILFHNEELSCDYIEAYREERKKFEIENMGANNFSDFKETELWKKYYTDGHCGLDKKVFDKLKKEEKTHIGIDDRIFQTLGVRVNPLSYLSFELSIDKSSLRKYLDSYLADFVSNKFNPGDRYTYSKQAQAIVIAIQKLIDAGYPKESLLIDPAQIFPKNMIDVRPTDGQQKTSILLYDFVDTVLAMEGEGFLKILDIQYQEKINKMITHSGQIWTDPIKIRINITDKFSKLFLKYIDPSKYEELESIEKQVKDMEDNPEKFRKIGKENTKRRKEEIKNIYSNIDYLSKAERKAWERKWNILQIIKTSYISATKLIKISIPIKKLAIKDYTIVEVDDILEGLKNEGVIGYWGGDTSNYSIVITKDFDEVYQRVERVYKKFSERYKEKTKAKKIIPLELPVNIKWEDITIKFENNYDVDIIISKDKNKHPYNYETMGFADERIKKSKEKTKAKDSWELLQLLSSNKGEFPLNSLTGKKKEERKKQKQSSTKILKELFPTVKDNPFCKYDDIKGIYKIKIKLIPVDTFKDDFRDRNIKDEAEDKLEWEDEYKKITSS